MREKMKSRKRPRGLVDLCCPLSLRCCKQKQKSNAKYQGNIDSRSICYLFFILFYFMASFLITHSLVMAFKSWCFPFFDHKIFVSNCLTLKKHIMQSKIWVLLSPYHLSISPLLVNFFDWLYSVYRPNNSVSV